MFELIGRYDTTKSGTLDRVEFETMVNYPEGFEEQEILNCLRIAPRKVTYPASKVYLSLRNGTLSALSAALALQKQIIIQTPTHLNPNPNP